MVREGATVLAVAGRLGSGDFASGSFEQFVNVGLVGLGMFGRQAAELRKKARRDSNGDELFGMAGFWPANTASAAEFVVSGFGDIGKIDLAIPHMLCVLCGLPGAR